MFKVNNDEEVFKLVTVLKDLSSFLQIIGRLSAMFIGQHFLLRLKLGLEYMKQLLVLVGFGSKTKLWTVGLSFNSKYDLKTNLIHCHSETIAGLKAWCHWLACLHSESLQDSSYTWVCSAQTYCTEKPLSPAPPPPASSPDSTSSVAPGACCCSRCWCTCP